MLAGGQFRYFLFHLVLWVSLLCVCYDVVLCPDVASIRSINCHSMQPSLLPSGWDGATQVIALFNVILPQDIATSTKILFVR